MTGKIRRAVQAGLWPLLFTPCLSFGQQLIVLMQRKDEFRKVGQSSRVHDNVVGRRQSLLTGCLGSQDALGLFDIRSIARHQAGNLIFFRAINHQNPVVGIHPPALDQQWNDMNLVGTACRRRPVRQLFANRRMRNGFQSAALCRIGEDALPQPFAIEVSRRIKYVATKCFDYLCQRGRPGIDDIARDLIGIEDRDSEFLEESANCRFAAGYAAGEDDEERAGLMPGA